jgi:membrane protein YdbS with pleckstrin-like domain
MNYINTNQDIDLLPNAQDIEHRNLEPNYLTVLLISTTLFYLIPCLILFIIFNIDFKEIPTELFYGLLSIIIFVLISSLVVKILGFKYKSYGLRQHDIIFKSGLIWREETIIPFNRIQHAEIGQGPIERMFDLSKLKVYTAGGSQSDLVIPGLSSSNAQNIKAFLIDKTRNYV